MAKGTRKCKICGEEYPYCRTENRAGTMRWQDVCCCPEHAAAYFEKVAAARAGKAVEAEPKAAAISVTIPAAETVEEAPKKSSPKRSRRKK